MNSVQSFTIDQSGKQFTLINELRNSTSIQFAYTVNGTSSTLSVVVLGCTNAGGEVFVLDSYVGNSNTTRTISLSQTFDYFLVIGTWSESGVSIGVTVTSSGPGPTYAGGVMLPLSGVGSPAGVVAAPVGSIYLNLNGGSAATLFVKESGGSTSSGWTAK